jgi:recombination associated protein RdgC
VQRSPVAVMTGWLEADEAPYNFTIDQDTELRATGESKAAVRYVKHSLDPEDIRRHIAAGKQCTRLAMTWNSRVSFVLTESLAIKGVKPLDVIKERRNHHLQRRRALRQRHDADDRRAAKMMADLVEALGGEAKA